MMDCCVTPSEPSIFYLFGAAWQLIVSMLPIFIILTLVGLIFGFIAPRIIDWWEKRKVRP
jgi:hypothetical protein